MGKERQPLSGLLKKTLPGSSHKGIFQAEADRIKEEKTLIRLCLPLCVKLAHSKGLSPRSGNFLRWRYHSFCYPKIMCIKVKINPVAEEYNFYSQAFGFGNQRADA